MIKTLDLVPRIPKIEKKEEEEEERKEEKEREKEVGRKKKEIIIIPRTSYEVLWPLGICPKLDLGTLVLSSLFHGLCSTMRFPP